MKDWKTYAIAALAVWCAALTYRNKNDSPRDGFATEEYSRKCALAVGCAVIGGNEKKNVEWLSDEIDNFGKPKKRADGKRAGSAKPSGPMLSIRRPPRPSLQSSTGDNEKEKELERMISDGKKKTINQLSDLKKNNPTHYEQHLMMTSRSLDRAEDMSKNYPLNFSDAFDKEQKEIEDRYGHEFLEDVLEYRRKKREKQSAK